MVLQSALGMSEEFLRSVSEVVVKRSLIDSDVVAGKTIVMPDVSRDPGFPSREAAQREGLYGVIGVPLSSRGRVTGTLRAYTGEPRDITEDETAVLRVIAKLTSRAIAGSKFFRAFWAIVGEVNSSLKAEEVLARLLESTVREINYMAASIRLVDVKTQTMRLVAATGLSAAYTGKGDVRLGQSRIDSEVLQGRAVTIYDVTTDPRWQYPKDAAREGIRSVQATPLAVKGTVIGVLRVYSGQPHRFDDEESGFLTAVANLGAMAIENARLHQALNEKYETLKTDASGWYRFLTMS